MAKYAYDEYPVRILYCCKFNLATNNVEGNPWYQVEDIEDGKQIQLLEEWLTRLPEEEQAMLALKYL